MNEAIDRQLWDDPIPPTDYLTEDGKTPAQEERDSAAMFGGVMLLTAAVVVGFVAYLLIAMPSD